jgi:hypothetical protein
LSGGCGEDGGIGWGRDAGAIEPVKRVVGIHRGLSSEVTLVVEDDERVRALSVETLKARLWRRRGLKPVAGVASA